MTIYLERDKSFLRSERKQVVRALIGQGFTLVKNSSRYSLYVRRRDAVLVNHHGIEINIVESSNGDKSSFIARFFQLPSMSLSSLRCEGRDRNGVLEGITPVFIT